MGKKKLNPTDQNLVQRLRITGHEIQRRLSLIQLTPADLEALRSAKPLITAEIDDIVNTFYENQVSLPEVARLIGDSESLARLRGAMRGYILSLFEGRPDTDYVLSRLRIGMVHNRIGVSPKLYVAAVQHLQQLLRQKLLDRDGQDCQACDRRLGALEKVLLFDLTMVFDTYIFSLMDQVERSKEELEEYAGSLEEVVAQRTRELSRQARLDGLTGLLNQRSFYQEFRRELSRAQRQRLHLSLIYIDIDKFKQVNDTLGHLQGDEVLIEVADSIRKTIREEDFASRYGGDEFVIILPQTDSQEALALADRLVNLASESNALAPISLSLGVATTGPENFPDPAELVKAADQAMYRAKKEEGYAVVVAEQFG